MCIRDRANPWSGDDDDDDNDEVYSSGICIQIMIIICNDNDTLLLPTLL